MKSPITGLEMQLIKKPIRLSFRKEDFEIVYHSYLCEESGEEFTDDALDQINQNQVYNGYRAKYGIPFPEEIKEIREQYGIAASKMSEILGLGANSYRLYETGEVPSVANGRLILAVKHPEDFMKQVHASAHILTEKETEQLLKKANHLIMEQHEKMWDMMLVKHIFRNEFPNEFTGFRSPNFEKIANAISYFGSAMQLYKTKLNKLLFYADFKYFQKTGFSITGLSYKAIPFGTVPENYDKVYLKLLDDEQIVIKQKMIGDYDCEIFEGADIFDESVFNPQELEVLNEVVNKFKDMSTRDVVELNHKEIAWIENVDERKKISYQQYAFNLIN